MGKRFNAKFQPIPYRNFIKKLFDKGQEVGIEIVENEESYTSQQDSFSNETYDQCINRYHNTGSRRIKRGLFQSATHQLVNADVNAALNIMTRHVNKLHSELLTHIQEYIQNNKQYLMNPVKIETKQILQTHHQLHKNWLWMHRGTQGLNKF